MLTKEESLAKSLTADTTEIIPFLPYLLQDFYELGSSAEDMIEIITPHLITPLNNVLDLGCGKGAISIAFAKTFNANVKGIDLMEAFIEEANSHAKRHNIEHLTHFEVTDIQEAVINEKEYDLVIYGAVGDVLGNPENLLSKLKECIHKNGYIIIDDAYGNEGIKTDYYTKSDWLHFIQNANLKLIAEKVVDMDELIAFNIKTMEFLRKRVQELIEKHPEHKAMFEHYLITQQAECDDLESSITGVTMLLKY